MNRRHSLPAEVYALVEQTPATVLLEGGKPDNNECRTESNEQPWTRLFTAPVRVCVAYDAAEIPALFAAIESAVAAGQSAAGFFSYECGSCFEPKAGMRRRARAGQASPALAQPLAQPLAWFGIYPRSYAFDHKTGKFVDGEPPELAHFRASERGAAARSRTQRRNRCRVCAHRSRIRKAHRRDSRVDSRRRRLSTQLHGSISAAKPKAARRRFMRACARASRSSTERFCTGSAGRHILSFSPELFFRVD